MLSCGPLAKYLCLFLHIAARKTCLKTKYGNVPSLLEDPCWVQKAESLDTATMSPAASFLSPSHVTSYRCSSRPVLTQLLLPLSWALAFLTLYLSGKHTVNLQDPKGQKVQSYFPSAAFPNFPRSSVSPQQDVLLSGTWRCFCNQSIISLATKLRALRGRDHDFFIQHMGSLNSTARFL